MMKVATVEKVSRIDTLDNFVLMGLDSTAKDSELVSHGDKIVKYNAGALEEEFQQKYFYFLPYQKGVLYYEQEGDPIFYTDFKTKVEFAAGGNSFNPLQDRSNKEVVLITEMDRSFNQSFYLYSNRIERQLLPKFSSLLLEDFFICTTKNKVELFNSDTLNLCWEYECDDDSQLDRRNKLFSDQDLLYVPLKGGILMCIDVQTGKIKWKWEGDDDYVSYGEKGGCIYVHEGNKILVVSKVNGQVENKIDYSDYPELDSFRSNGIIWCFDNVILVRNSGSGEVVLFDRETFELIGRETVDESGIGESKDRIQLIGDYLYILGTSSTVQIYNLKNVSDT